MALTATQKRVLNDLDKYIPALKHGQLAAADQLKLGDLFDQIQIALIASADVGAVAAATAVNPAAATAVTNSTANATDLATAEALANACKTQGNAMLTDVADIRTQLTALIADVAANRTRLTEIRTLLNEIKTSLNATQA